MNSNFKIQKLSGLIEEVSNRNNRNEVNEVFSVTNSEGFIKSTDYFDKKVFSKNISNYKIVKTSQFAYNPSRINVGSIDFLKTGVEVVISPLYVVFECKNNLVADYLLRYLKSSVGNAQIRNKTRGAVRDNLTFERLGEITIPLPPLSDQLKISKLLSKIDSLISKRKRSIKLIDDFLKSHYNKSFGDPIVNPKHWKKINFADIVNNENSKRVPVNQSNRDKRGGKYPYYGATGIIDMIDNYLFDGEFLLIAEDGKNLLLRKKNNAFYVKGKFWVNNHAHVLSSNGKVNLRYLEYFINYIDLKPFLTGIDQVKLNKENLDKIPVPIPPVKLQNKFAVLVQQSEVLKQHFSSSLGVLESFYTSLCYSAFRGELNLGNIEIDHILPIESSDVDSQDNLTIATKPENKPTARKTENILKIIVTKHFRVKPFRFEDLAEKIQAGLAEEVYDYNKIKHMVFDCLRGKGEIELKQIFKEDEKKILLQTL